MYILGLTTMTESAAVLLKDGVVVAAAEEERFSRRKHQGGFPHRAIRYVLDAEGIQMRDIADVAVYWNPYRFGHRVKVLAASFARHPKTAWAKIRRARQVWNGGSGEGSGWSTLFRLRQEFVHHFGAAPSRLRYLDHHRCHMAAAFFASPFEESAILIMDGAGEEACTTLGVGRGGELGKLAELRLPHSLGHFYSAVTGYLGFRMLDGEYKMMGLSPAGDPAGAVWIRKHFLQSPRSGQYVLRPEVLDYHRALRGNFDGEFARHFGPPREPDEADDVLDRHRDVAASAQRAFEEVVLDLSAWLRRETGLTSVAIGGGCGLNCTANGRILTSGIFERVYVPPVPHDAGGALGAAMLCYSEVTGRRPAPIRHAQYGPGFDDEQVRIAVRDRVGLTAVHCSEVELVGLAADSLARGEIVAWMQGRMEYGPRALGNRSFLASPLSDGVVGEMNEKIKKREPFRPFAPSVKEESASDYFEISQDSPFMTIIVPVRQDKRSTIPAVTHVDGSARPQTVSREANPRYWSLIDQFQHRTGVPVVLNTSFNIQEPIVCTPEEAMDTYCRSGVEAMAIGNYWVTRGEAT
ncbi:carbamoyltransferase C-terminal domain-containing protein [soil metagenome]